MDIKQYELEAKITNTLVLCINKIKDIKGLIEKLNTNVFSVACKDKIDYLKTLNFDNIVTRINTEITEISTLIDEKNSIWEEFNEQYKNYFIDRLKKIKIYANSLNNQDIIDSSSNEHYYEQLRNSINDFDNSIKRDSTFELYEHFKYGNKNYILFGKNGAGKTTLLKKLSSELLNSNTIVLPATRDIAYAENSYFSNNEVNLKHALVTNNGGKSLFFLGELLSNEDYRQLRNGVSSNETLLKTVISLFNQLGLDRKLLFNDRKNLCLEGENIAQYSISHASDGERSSIYILLAVLLSPTNSFIFIDEPENHLNGALMRKLFDLLEKERPDVKFIFATHNIQFIQSRQNIELIYLEKTNKYNEWSFKKFEEFEELPLDVILNIEGTNDNIIFCEGEDRFSFDCKLYEILFSDFEIVPVHGCENVEKQTNLINIYKLTFKKEAKGIVDRDFRNEEEIKRLKSNNITVLKVNEIENIFILPCCLISMSNILTNNKSIDKIKDEIISKINSKIDSILQDFATKLLRKIQLQNKFKKLDDIENDLNGISKANKDKFLEEYHCFESYILKSIKNKDYDTLMQIVPGKQIISDVVKIVGFANVTLYVNKLLLQINEDSQLQKEILKFIEI